MGTIVSTRETQFHYFDQVLENPVWRGRKILDFGGNVGGFLVGAEGHIDLEDYWCLDLNQEVIERGRQKYPRAHFLHYNRYSSQYNPNGLRNLPVPDLGLRFDVVLAFSVFTHTHQTEMLELVQQLHRLLAPEAIIAFTFTDPRYDRSLSDPKLPSGTDVRKILEWRQAENPSLQIESMVETARWSNWCLVIDDKLHLEPGNNLSNQEHQGRPWESYCSYFTADYIGSLFPRAKVCPPVSPEWQHCCVLRKTV
jgi:SAM-dependent methyltransferase